MASTTRTRERGGAGTDLVAGLRSLAGASLAAVGGKALNLGRLAAAGFPVPSGFCLTTAAYRMAAPNELDGIATRLDGAEQPGQADRHDQAGRAGQAETHDGGRALPDEDRNQLAWSAREAMVAAPVPLEVDAALREAYAAMGGGPVAVRSSATAEDLPFASFARQQDSFMDVVGADAVVQAVRQCWASLWTDRAVAYRATNGISHREASLAVVIQRMVDASMAGVRLRSGPACRRRPTQGYSRVSRHGHGEVRVVLDPVGAHVEPGEILVAPSTDPGWTPLFMTAGALVMEMGGVISHGAVVAREYGIPAVVGVADATTRLRDGRVVTVDGAAGTVTW